VEGEPEPLSPSGVEASMNEGDEPVLTMKALRPFVPARDFEISKQFYADLGFQIEPLGKDLALVSIRELSFLLQNFYVAQFAENFVMHALVADLSSWWNRIVSLDLPSRYAVQNPRAPKLESWGLNVAYVFDPSGVLWHFAERPSSSTAATSS
jgi:hypothetical protein